MSSKVFNLAILVQFNFLLIRFDFLLSNLYSLRAKIRRIRTLGHLYHGERNLSSKSSRVVSHSELFFMYTSNEFGMPCLMHSFIYIWSLTYRFRRESLEPLRVAMVV